MTLKSYEQCFHHIKFEYFPKMVLECFLDWYCLITNKNLPTSFPERAIGKNHNFLIYVTHSCLLTTIYIQNLWFLVAHFFQSVLKFCFFKYLSFKKQFVNHFHRKVFVWMTVIHFCFIPINMIWKGTSREGWYNREKKKEKKGYIINITSRGCSDHTM